MGAFTVVSVGCYAACAVTSTESNICWGSNEDKQITTEPMTGTCTGVSLGESAACAINSTGSVTCWGNGLSQRISAKPTYCFYARVQITNQGAQIKVTEVSSCQF